MLCQDAVEFMFGLLSKPTTTKIQYTRPVKWSWGVKVKENRDAAYTSCLVGDGG